MKTCKINSKIISLCIAVALVFGVFAGMTVTVSAATQLPAPGNPHWDGDTGTAVWDNVPDSGTNLGPDGVAYVLRLYKKASATPPNPSDTDYEVELYPDGNTTAPTYSASLSSHLNSDGYYYFTVAAKGDGSNYDQSPFVVSDVFHYTVATVKLPTPTNPVWKTVGEEHYATWTDHTDYVDADTFVVTFYSEAEGMLGASAWPKDKIVHGIPLSTHIKSLYGIYYFTVRVESSRPTLFLSSEVSDFSGRITVGTPPVITSPDGNSTSSGGGGSSDSGDSSGTTATTSTTKATITAEQIGGGSQQMDNYSWRVDLPVLGFQSATVGGEELVRGRDYTIREGSTILTLTDSYLATLKPGSYTVKMEFLAATATIDFTVESTGGSGSPTPTGTDETWEGSASSNTNANPSTGR